MPITPFMGVLISWLIFARNSLFARLAACARKAISLARVVASESRRLVARTLSSVSLRSVISRSTPATPEGRPPSSKRSLAPTDTWSKVPSFFLSTSSWSLTRPYLYRVRRRTSRSEFSA